MIIISSSSSSSIVLILLFYCCYCCYCCYCLLLIVYWLWSIVYCVWFIVYCLLGQGTLPDLRGVHGCSKASSNGISLVSGILQRIVTCPVDVYWTFPTGPQGNFPMEFRFCDFRRVIVCPDWGMHMMLHHTAPRSPALVHVEDRIQEANILLQKILLRNTSTIFCSTDYSSTILCSEYYVRQTLVRYSAILLRYSVRRLYYFAPEVSRKKSRKR